jgi:hypothetical protein
LTRKHDEPLSTSAFKFKLRRYNVGIADQGYQSYYLTNLAPTGNVHPYIATGQELMHSARHVTGRQ